MDLRWELAHFVVFFCFSLRSILVFQTKTKINVRFRNDKKELAKLAKDKQEPVTEEQARKMQRDIGALEYVECSAMTRENLKEVFDEAIKAILLAPEPEPKKKRCVLF